MPSVASYWTVISVGIGDGSVNATVPFQLRVIAPSEVADVVADSLAGQSHVLSITRHRTVDVPSGSDLVVADVADAAVNDVIAALGRIDADVDLEVGITYIAMSGRFR